MPVWALQAMQRDALQQQASSLALLGFQDWQCLAALVHSRGSLQGALVTLLDGWLDTPSQAQSLLRHVLSEDRGEGEHGTAALAPPSQAQVGALRPLGGGQMLYGTRLWDVKACRAVCVCVCVRA